MGTKPNISPQTTETCSCLQNNSSRNTISMTENLFLELILKVRAFIFLFLSRSHAAACARVCVFSLSVCWYEQTGAGHNTLLVFSGLSSCHTVAHGTCPVIWTDLLDLSADFTVAYLLRGMSPVKLYYQTVLFLKFLYMFCRAGTLSR